MQQKVYTIDQFKKLVPTKNTKINLFIEYYGEDKINTLFEYCMFFERFDIAAKILKKYKNLINPNKYSYGEISIKGFKFILDNNIKVNKDIISFMIYI